MAVTDDEIPVMPLLQIRKVAPAKRTPLLARWAVAKSWALTRGLF